MVGIIEFIDISNIIVVFFGSFGVVDIVNIKI